MGYRFNPYKVNPYIIHIGLNILLSLNNDDDDIQLFLSVYVPCATLNNYHHHLIAEEI